MYVLWTTVFWVLMAASLGCDVVVFTKRTTEPDRTLGLAGLLFILGIAVVVFTPATWG